jgi:hypothetical protein
VAHRDECLGAAPARFAPEAPRRVRDRRRLLGPVRDVLRDLVFPACILV